MREKPNNGYADPFGLIAASAAAFLPPEAISVADYAAQHRNLANEGGGYVGRWSHEIAPYLVEPMETLRGQAHLTTAIVGCAQSGKTEIGQNWLLHTVGADPAPMLWYMQTDPGVEAYVKARINPMIDAHPIMRGRLGTRPTDDSLHFKRFDGMTAEFLAAVPSNVINKSAGRIVADEWDAYPKSLGDPKTMLDRRRETFGRDSMLLAMSHCDLATGMDPARDWSQGIMALYADSDRRTWWWRCPHCGAYSSPNPTASRVMALEYPADGTLDEVQRGARLICPVNGCEIEDHERRAMNLTGRWIGLGQEIDEEGQVSGVLTPRDTAGFWIVGVMSPFIMNGIGGLARSIVKAMRDAEMSGDDSGLKQVIVKQVGIPYTPKRQVGALDATVIADRADEKLKLGTVPEGVRFLTAGVDVQGNRFEALVRGWGEGGQSWIVDVRRIDADPATSAADWDAMLEGLLDAEYPLIDADGVLGGRAMRIRCIAYDTGGGPGVTRLAYEAWLRFRQRGRIKLLGTFDGRHGWNVVPTKGLGGLNAPKLQVVYPDTQRKDRRSGARGQVPQGQFAANAFKDDLAGQLAQGAPGGWFVNAPYELRSAEPPHAWFEQLVAESRLPDGRWEKTQARNEALDLMVLSHVAAHLHGLAKMRWDRPPAWAAEWSRNPMVGPVRSGPAVSAAGGLESPGGPARPATDAPARAAPAPAVQATALRRPGTSSTRSDVLRKLAARMGR